MVLPPFDGTSVGDVAIFVSAEHGFISQQTLANVELLARVVDKIDCPNYGSIYIWADFSAYGLYVYDWKDSYRSYYRMRSPKGKLDTSIISSDVPLEVFTRKFSDTKFVKDESKFESFIRVVKPSPRRFRLQDIFKF